MKANKCLVLFLVTCLVLCMVFCLGVAAHDDHDHDHETETSEGLSTHTIVSLCIAGAAVFGVTVFCIIKHEKVAEAMRSYKRELKNITWFSWNQVVRCTVFVIIAILAVAVAVGLLDILFFNVQNLLTGKGIEIFGK